jgi:hypothetical protein|tara:strand:- start:142 stop:477 length:336 start_codon:yes stop_codon:yes gene_type:complete
MVKEEVDTMSKGIDDILVDYFDDDLSTQEKDRDFCLLIRQFHALEKWVSEADEIMALMQENLFCIEDKELLNHINDRCDNLETTHIAINKTMEVWPYRKELKDLLKLVREF